MHVSREDHQDARRALERVADRTAQLFALGSGPATAIPGSQWTVAEVGAHLLIALRGFTEAVRGNSGQWADAAAGAGTFSERLAAFNDLMIGDEPRRDLATVGELVVDATRGFLAASDGRPPEEHVFTPWYGPEATLPVGAATCLLLGEQLMHGYDVAQAVAAPWEIGHRDACLTFHAVTAMMPLLLNGPAAVGMRATFDLRLRKGQRVIVRLEDGAVHVEPPGTQKIDCHLSADPVAFLLIGYGRLNQWRAISRGKLYAWGRRPWLGPQLKGLFYNP